jgi:hypothetical protein
MIIIDDRSDDETPDIAESFDDPRIIVPRQPRERITGLGRLYATPVSTPISDKVTSARMRQCVGQCQICEHGPYAPGVGTP